MTFFKAGIYLALEVLSAKEQLNVLFSRNNDAFETFESKYFFKSHKFSFFNRTFFLQTCL